MFRVRSVWSGGSMGSGLSVMHFGGLAEDEGSLDDLAAAVTEFWDDIKEGLAGGVTVQTQNIIDLIDTEDGGLLGSFGVPAQAVKAPSGAYAYAAGVGMRVRWQTAGIRNDRRVIGTTFIVPITSAQYEINGTIITSWHTTVTTAAATLLSSTAALGLPMHVWSRPSTPGGSDGISSVVTASVVPDKVSWLKTRRS